MCALQAMEQKQLQREAMQRLNMMIDELRNSQNADLSAKNLGDEGCIFISEGFAFNDRCAAPAVHLTMLCSILQKPACKWRLPLLHHIAQHSPRRQRKPQRHSSKLDVA